jgi:ribonuclease BN (tRNA processing enzyme)
MLNQASEPSLMDENIELVFLGTGNAFSMDNRYWSSILVNDRILLDASPMVVPHMKRLGKNLTNLEYIFITHFHADHFFGLPYIFLDFGYLIEKSLPLTIIGPPALMDRITRITELGFSGLSEKLRGRLEVNYNEVAKPGLYSVSGLDFTAERMKHGNTETFGYKFTEAGKTIAYTGDTDLCDGVIELGLESDVLIIEMSNPNNDVPGHMNLEKLKQLREKLSSNVKIILNHIGEFAGEIPKYDNVYIPQDLEVLRV